jgi:isoleucyl-tRNA synthetase
VRQPLSRLLVYLKSEKERAELKKMTAIVCDELNIKSVEIVDSTDQLISRSAKPNFKILGPKVGKLMNKLAPVVQGFSNEQIAAIEKNGYERVSLEGQEIKVLIEDIEIRTESKEGYATYTDPDLTLALDLTLNDDLIEEGLARELINRVQNIRKESEFSVTDRIEIYLDGQSSQMAKAVKSKMNYIMSETLAVKITDRNGEQLNFKEITIGEESFLIGLKKNENVQEV